MAIVGVVAMLAVSLGRAWLTLSIPTLIIMEALAIGATILYQPVLSGTAYDIMKDSNKALAPFLRPIIRRL
jgi:hypothetical protein